MRTTISLFLLSLSISLPALAVETFDLGLPEDLPRPSSSIRAPASSLDEEFEVSKSPYESAFTSYHSKQSSDDEVVDQSDAWRKNQEKPDSFDLDTMTYNEKIQPSAVSAKDRKALVMQTISRYYPELKACYQEGLRRNSSMKGKVVVGWSMDKNGQVVGAEMQSSQLKNEGVEKCMLGRMSNWRFPPQAKLQGSSDRMTYTFQFVPEKD